MKQLKIVLIILSMVIFNLCGAATSFTGYFPKGCKLNNDAGGVVGTCICIQDTTTHDIWLATSSEGGMSWDGSTGVSLGAKNWIKALNASAICGITNNGVTLGNGWSLPNSTQLATLAGHSSDWFGNNGFVDIDTKGYYYAASSGKYMASYISIANGTVDTMLKNYRDSHVHAFAVYTPPKQQ